MPYAPQAVFTPANSTQPGMEMLSRGIANAGADFGQLRKQAKAADALFKAVAPDEDPVTGEKAPNPIMPEDQWSTLGASDKVAAMGAYVKKTALQSAMAEQQALQAKAAQEQTAAAAPMAASKLMSAMNDRANNDPQFAATLSPLARAVLDAGSKMGAGQKGDAAGTWKFLQSIMGNSGEDNTPQSMTGPNGETIFYQPKTKNPLMFSPVTKSDAAISVLQAKDANKPKAGEVTPEDQFKDLGNQIKAIRATPAAMRTADENQALADLIQKQTALTTKTAAAPSGGAPTAANGSAPSGGAPGAKALTPDIAAQYLKAAGGDKAKARLKAKADGYSF